MKLLICNSNMFVPIVLTQVLDNPTEIFVVAVNTDNLEMLFNKIGIKNITIERYRSSYYYWNARKEKRRLIDQFSKYPINAVYFYHTEEGRSAEYLINYLSKKAIIFHVPLYKPFPLKKVYSLRSLKRRLLYWYLYGNIPEMKDLKIDMIPSISKKFLSKVNAKHESISINYNSVYNSIKPLLRLEDKREIVWLCGAIKEFGVNISKYPFEIFNIISAIGLNKVIVKSHPIFSDLYGIEKELPSIPSYLPMNLIIPNFKCYIGYGTTVLAEAAEAGILSISILYLISTNSDNRDLIRKAMDVKDSNHKILYPKTIDELIGFIGILQ